MAIVTRNRVKALLGIESDRHNARISALIPVVEADYLAIRGSAFETDDNGDTVYPDTAEWTATKMIDWIINGSQPGVISEDVNEYSVQLQSERIMGYPADVVAGVEITGCYQ